MLRADYTLFNWKQILYSVFLQSSITAPIMEFYDRVVQIRSNHFIVISCKICILANLTLQLFLRTEHKGYCEKISYFGTLLSFTILLNNRDKLSCF